MNDRLIIKKSNFKIIFSISKKIMKKKLRYARYVLSYYHISVLGYLDIEFHGNNLNSKLFETFCFSYVLKSPKKKYLKEIFLQIHEKFR